MSTFNNILKVLALLVACGFLYVWWLRRDAGRYAMVGDTKESSDITILDTHTGVLFSCGVSNGKSFSCLEILPRRGTAESVK